LDINYCLPESEIGVLLNDNPALYRDELGRTVLHFAADMGYMELAQLLVVNGADVNARDKQERAPLHEAVAGVHRKSYATTRGATARQEAQCKAVADLLLSNQANANPKDKDGRTPLHEAAWHGLTAMAKLLLANKAEVNAMDNYGATPLSKAGCYGWKGDDDETKKLLRQHGGRDFFSEFIYGAARNGDLAKVRSLLQEIPDVALCRDDHHLRFKHKGTTAMHEAAKHGHAAVIELLLANKADVNARESADSTPLLSTKRTSCG